MRKRPIIQYEEPPKSRFCPLCGTENPGASKKCSRCGTTLTPTKGAAFGVGDDAGLSQISYATEPNPLEGGGKRRSRKRSKGGGKARTGRGGDAPELNPIEAFMSCMSKYGDTNGRASRSEYWWFQFDVLIVSIVWMFVAMFVCGVCGLLDTDPSNPDATPLAIPIVLLSPGAFFFLPQLAVFIRRIHDRGESGAMFFLLFIPFVGQMYYFVVTLLAGQRGPNDYDN